MKLLNCFLTDLDTDIWLLDRTGIEVDQRSRGSLALRGEKIVLPYQGTHIRISATGIACLPI
jgi:hypothetical protein